MSYTIRPYILRDIKNRPLKAEVCADEAAARKYATGWNDAANRCNHSDMLAYTIETPSGRIVDLVVPVSQEVEG